MNGSFDDGKGMAEIGWAIERKCMYWAAVTVMDDWIREAGHAEGSSRVEKSSSEVSEVPTGSGVWTMHSW